MNKKTLWLTKTSLLACVAIVLSIIESFFPYISLPIPGAKIGISNIAVMVGASTTGMFSALTIVAVKACLTGITRGVLAFLLSLFGGIISVLLMCSAMKIPGKPFGYFGVGVIGALSNNITQLFVSSLLTSTAILFYLPMLMLISLVTGSITGISMGLLMPSIEKTKFLKVVKNS